MTTDVEDLTTFYSNLPSIFENNSSASIDSSYNTIVPDVNKKKSYQPMFGSFLFADSDPLSRAAFIAPSSTSIPLETTEEQLMDDCALGNENNISSSIQTTLSSAPPLVSMEDIDDNEDDFDGIPIRHASIIIEKKLNGDNDLINNHSTDDDLFNEFISHIENLHDDDNDMEVDSFLNGFIDEQHDTIGVVPSLFKDIPDIDDSNEHEEDNTDRISFDHMDIFDQSDSIRSSSPDSLLSSSNLQDEQDVVDDDDDDDNEVAQWNDDLILDTTSSNINTKTNRENSSLILHVNPFEQVNFIDSSRSNSRCSNISSNLSIGYTDQARIFMSDNELLTSSDSDNNDDNINFDCDRFNHDDICLEVNLDSPLSKSNNTRSSSSSSIPDETPIIDIDQDNNESKNFHTAPIAAIDDEDDDFEIFLSDEPILPNLSSNIETNLQLNIEKQKHEIVHDIVNIRHLYNENEHDDEFIAIMHNPTIFEQVLYDHDDQKESDSIKQINFVSSTFQSSSQLSHDNNTKQDSFEHQKNIHQISSLLESNEKDISSSSFSYPRKTTTTNNSSPAVNHLTKQEREKDASMNVVNAIDILNKKREKQQLHYEQINTSDIDLKQLTNSQNYYQNMNTNNEHDDNDSELLKTLSQLHDIINPTQSFEEFNQEKNSSDFSTEKLIIDDNETDLLNKKNQHSRHIISSSPYVVDRIKNSNKEEQEEKTEKENVFLHKNNDYDDVDDTKKEKYQRKEEEEKKKATTVLSLTSSTSPISILFNDESHTPNVNVDLNASSSLPNLLLLSSNQVNDSTVFSNQLITDDLQISNTKINMNKSSNDDDFTQQTASNLFDPFAPTTTTTTTTKMLDDVLVDTNDVDVKEFDLQSNFLPENSNSTQLLSNYNFDDLWSQSMSHIVSSDHHEIKSNNDIDTNTFGWDAFFNNNNTTEKTNPNSNITWESLFNVEQKQEQEEEEDQNDLKNFLHWIISHLDNTEPITQFTSTHNLEGIIKDIQMCSMPFEPIPSPPLHVDHTVSNPMINAIHHELFPIDELEQPNILQGQQSMTLYEEDEDEQNNKISSFDNELQLIVEKLVSDTLQLALTEINDSYHPVEHFVDQIITQAIFEVYNEDKNKSELEINDTTSTENLASIINWHDQTKAANTQLLDPFDTKFDTIWSSHFQVPDDTTNENIFESKTNIDPWLTTTTSSESNNNVDPILFFSKTLDEADLFSSTSNLKTKPQDIEDDETGTLSEYIPPLLLTNPSNTTTTVNNLMKYTLTAPVMDDSGDDSSTLEEYLIPHKSESSIITKEKVDEGTNNMTLREQNKQDNLFSSNARFSQFEVFGSDEPLNSPDIHSKFANQITQFDNESSQVQQSTDDNTLWTSIEKPTEFNKSNDINDNEPWELEDQDEEKITPIPTTTRFSAAFDDKEFLTKEKFDSDKNFFSDSFNPNENMEQTLPKTVRFDDNVQNIRVPTPPIDDFESSSTTTNDSNDIKVEDITPSFETINNHMETSYVNVEKTDIIEFPSKSVELTPQNENLSLPFNDKTNISNDNIPLQSTLASSNTESPSKINLRAQSQLIPAIQTTTDTQIVQSSESGILIFSICIY